MYFDYRSCMSSQYRNNHYVPQWYQKRFIPDAQPEKKLYYLDFKPGVFVDPRGVAHPINPVRRQGVRHCFTQEDLYTRQFGAGLSTDIEQNFFGEIDRRGLAAVEYWADFAHPSVDYDAFSDVMMYMSTQKLRTPKGLGWISSIAGTRNQNEVLRKMLNLRRLHCALWTECIWQIADASRSDTKFIISDHPVTVYNRMCGPRSRRWCMDYKDPYIWHQGTHTLFPLSLDKILILTNLSWVRNPYQSALNNRPHPSPMRDAMFHYWDIQTSRYLTEQEVREINFITKSRALRYIAAAKEEWLYPESYVSKSDWHNYGNGYLLMPDPRPIQTRGETIIGYTDGTAASADQYGRRSWQRDYNSELNSGSEQLSSQRFKGEFARLFGPRRRGLTFHGASLDAEQDDDEFHKYHLSLERRRR